MVHTTPGISPGAISPRRSQQRAKDVTAAPQAFLDLFCLVMCLPFDEQYDQAAIHTRPASTYTNTGRGQSCSRDAAAEAFLKACHFLLLLWRALHRPWLLIPPLPPRPQRRRRRTNICRYCSRRALQRTLTRATSKRSWTRSRPPPVLPPSMPRTGKRLSPQAKPTSTRTMLVPVTPRKIVATVATETFYGLRLIQNRKAPATPTRPSLAL